MSQAGESRTLMKRKGEEGVIKGNGKKTHKDYGMKDLPLTWGFWEQKCPNYSRLRKERGGGLDFKKFKTRKERETRSRGLGGTTWGNKRNRGMKIRGIV